jgi:hypothetical protein
VNYRCGTIRLATMFTDEITESRGSTNRLSSYRWSLWSIAVTIATALMALAAIQYLYHRGMWHQESSLSSFIDGIGGLAVLVSFTLAVVGFKKGESPVVGAIAFFLSLFSVALYAR